MSLAALQQLDALLASRAVAGCGQWGFTRLVLRRCLLRLRQILRVTRIFRLMRVLKLFQQYLVRPCGAMCMNDWECCDAKMGHACMPGPMPCEGLSISGSADPQRKPQV